jgi:hypothetical protein
MQMDESGEVAACLVVVRGALDRNWADYLGPLSTLTFVDENQTVSTMLSGPVADFAAFVGLILRLQNLGLPVQSISYQRLPSRHLA